MHRHHNFTGEKENHLNNRLPLSWNEKDNAASRFHSHEHKPQPCDQAERKSGARPFQMKPRLNVSLKRINVLVDSTRRYAAHLAIDAVDVRKENEAQRQAKHSERVEKYGHLLDQSESHAKLAFEVLHFATVRFVIVAHKMKHSVQNQDLQFLGERPAKSPRIPLRNARRYRNVAEVF